MLYLSRQYSVADGDRRRLIPAAMGIFGHGNVAGLGQALDQYCRATCRSSRAATSRTWSTSPAGFAKASKRRATLAVTASIGPGALNMVTGAALATVNRLPVLLLPGDSYATRRQGPVLQQLQHPIEADASVNDAFRPVSRFFDRITRPEQLLTALPAAMRVLVDPVEHRRRRPVAAAGRPVARPRLPRGVLRRARLGRSAARSPSRTEVAALVELFAAGVPSAHHRRWRRALLRRERRARAARRSRRRPGRRDLRRQGRRPRRRLVAARRASAWRATRRPTRSPATPTSWSPSGPG